MVFRRLAAGAGSEACSWTKATARSPRRAGAGNIDTSPVGFAVFDRVLITVHPTDCAGARVLLRLAGLATGAKAAARRACPAARPT
jgi:magnesium transporter